MLGHSVITSNMINNTHTHTQCLKRFRLKHELTVRVCSQPFILRRIYARNRSTGTAHSFRSHLNQSAG